MGLNYTNLPGWLERNSFFRKGFLIRKMFLSKVRAIHYAQFAEDVSIGRLFPKEYTGFFVDVGCFHPKKFSNTWLLYKKGWRGINIDIDSIKVDGFNLVRKKDTNIHSAVSDSTGEVVYYANGFFSPTTSLDSSFVEGKTGYVEKRATCAKLSDIIDGSKYKNRTIDFLTVDAEGHDLDVLQSLDFDRYNPRLIAVETHKVLFSEVVETPLYKFLLSKEYCLVGWSGLTLLMANKELQKTLVK